MKLSFLKCYLEKSNFSYYICAKTLKKEMLKKDLDPDRPLDLDLKKGIKIEGKAKVEVVAEVEVEVNIRTKREMTTIQVEVTAQKIVGEINEAHFKLSVNIGQGVNHQTQEAVAAGEQEGKNNSGFS